jgi:atypical dual specificity phosphatase
MRAFWWFREDLIAGMARPGFNHSHWFDLKFDEAILLGWIGQYSTGSLALSDWNLHLENYAPKVLKFYKIDELEGSSILQKMKNAEGLQKLLERLSASTKLLKSFKIKDAEIEIEYDKSFVEKEIHNLKEKNISKVISLTERQHDSELLNKHFDTFHFSIKDLTAPSMEQVIELSKIFQEAKKNKEKTAIHCLAGVGRTSTMIIASHLALGESLEELKATVAKQNPHYVLTGSQADFIDSVKEKFSVRN